MLNVEGIITNSIINISRTDNQRKGVYIVILYWDLYVTKKKKKERRES